MIILFGGSKDFDGRRGRIFGFGVRIVGENSVKTAFVLLERLLVGESSGDEADNRICYWIWKSPAPSKVVAFSWKLLLDKIPTHGYLVVRNVILASGIDKLWFDSFCFLEFCVAALLFLRCSGCSSRGIYFVL